MKEIQSTEMVSIDHFLEELAAIVGVPRRKIERMYFQGQRDREVPPALKRRAKTPLKKARTSK